MLRTEWVLCPFCGNKTRLKIRSDTELKNFPLYCPKCRQWNIHVRVAVEVTFKILVALAIIVHL